MRCCICGFDMLWRHNGETHDETHGEYLGNSCVVYGYRNHLIEDEADHEGHIAGIDHSRCCDWCDRLYETPARMGKIGQEREMLGRMMVIANELSIRHFEQMMKAEREKNG